jgi:hypothetical protein
LTSGDERQHQQRDDNELLLCRHVESHFFSEETACQEILTCYKWSEARHWVNGRRIRTNKSACGLRWAKPLPLGLITPHSRIGGVRVRGMICGLRVH